MGDYADDAIDRGIHETCPMGEDEVIAMDDDAADGAVGIVICCRRGRRPVPPRGPHVSAATMTKLKEKFVGPKPKRPARHR